MSRIPLAEEAIDGRFATDEEEVMMNITDEVQELDFDEYDEIAPRFEETDDDDNEDF